MSKLIDTKVRLTIRQKKWIEKIAHARKVSEAQIIRDAIVYLAEETYQVFLK